MNEVASGESEDDPDLDPDLNEQFTFGKWTGSRFIFKKVHKWAVKDVGCDAKTIGSFLQYCWAFCENDEEEDRMFEWMLSLVTLYVGEDGWKGFCEGPLLWDWSKAAIRDQWEIPTPDFASSREAEDIMNGLGKVEVNDEDEVKDIEVKKFELKEIVEKEEVVKGSVQKESVQKESLDKESVKKESVKKESVKKESVKKESVQKESLVKEVVEVELKENEVKKDKTKEGEGKLQVHVLKEEKREVASPSSTWGSQLPPATPPKQKPLTAWRPWEAGPQKQKKRSPASEARSWRRLHVWQQRKDLQRSSNHMPKQSYSTPLPPQKELKVVRLVERLECEDRGDFGSQAPPFNHWSESRAPNFPPLMSGSQTSCSPPWSGSETTSSSLPWSGSQTFPSPPPRSGSQTFPSPPPWSGSQTFPPSSPWSGSQTLPSPPPWSGNWGNVHQDKWLFASTLRNQTMLQQSFPSLATLPSPIPGFSPSPPAVQAGSTWGLLPALVTACPSCLAWGLLTPT